ncbi:heme NO-binding domain-containing protein [Thalassotalea euphylliae]|uniref:heme NO-binding domain-containing protein n=1 Tax=Thalassotalea euphylliae TaxID=1655234 RepID=UPI0036254723
MKGAVFVGFSDFVEQTYGLTTWLKALDSVSLPSNGEYISTEIYEDEELFTLLGAINELTSVTAIDLSRQFGRYFFKTLYSITQHHVADIENLFEFLEAVDNVIHIEVKKADPLAYTPTLLYDQPSDDTLIVRYMSKRKMCHFAEGLILGAADHFDQPVDVSQIACMHEGEKHCLIKVTKQAS